MKEFSINEYTALRKSAKEDFEQYFDRKTGKITILEKQVFMWDGTSLFRKQDFHAKVKKHNEQFGKGFSKYTINAGRSKTLDAMIDLLMSRLYVGQVSMDGYVSSSFAGLKERAGYKDAKSAHQHINTFVLTNVCQIRNIEESKEIGKSGFKYQTFEFRINPYFLPFLNEVYKDLWDCYTMWEDSPMVSLDLEKETMQAKKDDKQIQTNETREKLLQIVKSDKQILFESLLEKSQEEQDAYFVGLLTSLGRKIEHTDRRNTSKLLQEFHAFKNKRNNIYEKIWNVNRQQPKSKPAQATEQRTALGFTVQASQTATATAQQSAPAFTNTKEIDKELAKEEFNPNLRNHDISKETSDPRVQNIYKQVLASKNPMYEDRPIPKPIKTPMPMPSRNSERPPASNIWEELEKDKINRQQQQTKQINRHNNIFNELQQKVITTLIKTVNPNTLYEHELTMLQKLDILELTENYINQSDIDYNKFQNSEWIWNLKT